MELFTHHGIGSMIVLESPDLLRDAALADIDGILAIIDPLVAQGILVKRDRALNRAAKNYRELFRAIREIVIAKREGVNG